MTDEFFGSKANPDEMLTPELRIQIQSQPNNEPDQRQIELTEAEQAEIERIEEMAEGLYLQTINFAKKMGFDPETNFNIDNDQRLIELASLFNEAANSNRSEVVSFLFSEKEINNLQDLDSEIRNGRKVAPTISLDFPNVGMDLMNGNQYLNGHGQLINPSHYNAGQMPYSSGVKLLLLNKLDDDLANAFNTVDDVVAELSELKKQMSKLLSSKGIQSNVDISSPRYYQNLIDHENTFTFAPMLETASRTVVRLIVNISVIMAQRTAYVGEKIRLADPKFHPVDTAKLLNDQETAGKFLRTRRNVFGGDPEAVTTLYLVDSTYEFTEEDSRAAVEANLPWSKIDQAK